MNINSITFRVADAVAGRTAGSPLAAVELRQDSITGPILHHREPDLDGRYDDLVQPDVPVLAVGAQLGTHQLFLVFREVTNGATGANLFNLNWAEFNGQGVGS